jgi:hypothetical protein
MMQKKLILTLFILIFFSNSYGQNVYEDELSIYEFDFYYSDSIDSDITFGDYKPTGIVSLQDGSLIVSTEIHLYFPDQYKTATEFTPEYFQQQKVFSSKSHISSGSVFKLDNDYQKQWEITFKEKRIVGIKKLSDESILVVGEQVDMKIFWIAKIDTNGNILFEKDYKFGQKPNIANIEVDSFDNIYILLNCERLYPVKITNFYGRKRIRFFQVSDMENDLYLLKISPQGKILWKTPLDKRKNITTFGYDLIIEKNIYVSTSYDGFVKHEKHKGEMMYEINNRGKILTTMPIENKRILLMDSLLVFTTKSHNDSLVLYYYQKESDLLRPIETIIFKDDVKHFWAKKAIDAQTSNYIFGTNSHNLGCLLVELNKRNQFVGYWANERKNMSNFVDATIKPDDSIVILSCRYDIPLKSDDSSRKYSIRLIEIKKK